MSTKKKESFIYPIAFMVAISILFTSILATLNQTTYANIKQQEDNQLRKSILYSLDVDFSSDEDIDAIFTENMKMVSNDNISYYEYQVQGQTRAYAFPVEGKALWGTVDAYAAVNKDVTELLGIDFIRHSETPGLGGRISEDWYKEQFRGIDISGNSPYFIYKPQSGGNIDAITGATLTSVSIRDMINSSVDTFKENYEGGR